MEHKIKVCKRFFFTLFLAAAVLTGLLVAVELVFPPHAAARNLPSNHLVSSYQGPLSTLASPPVSFIQATSVATLYLPIIVKNPLLVYFDDFSDSDSDWPEANDGDCESLYNSGRYQLNIDQDKTCIPRAAPSSAATRTYGEFEVSVYHSGEHENDDNDEVSDAVFGIFTNGEGGGNYYVFKIRPNISNCSVGGGWQFIRRRNDSETTLKRVDCTNLIKRGFGSGGINTIKLKHDRNGVITLYIKHQGVFQAVFSTNEAATGKELRGKTTGVYAEAATDLPSVIKFDDFRVFALP
jgi:hypothetical protein